MCPFLCSATESHRGSVGSTLIREAEDWGKTQRNTNDEHIGSLPRFTSTFTCIALGLLRQLLRGHYRRGSRSSEAGLRTPLHLTPVLHSPSGHILLAGGGGVLERSGSCRGNTVFTQTPSRGRHTLSHGEGCVLWACLCVFLSFYSCC
jgi:hypothetical protein